MTDLW